MTHSSKFIDQERIWGAHNYHPLPVVLSRGEGVFLWDVEGKKYLDMMSAYSAVSHGHSHPRLVKALVDQAKELSVVSRAFYTNRLPPLLEKICQLSGFDKALPMNTGAEAVETAIKAVRRYAYEVKGIKEHEAEIIVADGNFHGRTTTIISFSSEAAYKKGFGPFTPGFKNIPYGDLEALKKAINPNTVAFLIEAIQGEAGIKIPSEGWLKSCQEYCHEKDVLFILDEVQTGLGRTGKLFAFQHENVKPDGLILGKALGGGLLPISMFLGKKKLMDVFTPASHGSTFGGNPLASRVALEALNVLEEERLVENCEKMGAYFLSELKTIKSPFIQDVRGKGLLIGMEINPKKSTARAMCEKLMELGILSKETHETVVRFAPPLIIQKPELDWAILQIKKALSVL